MTARLQPAERPASSRRRPRPALGVSDPRVSWVHGCFQGMLAAAPGDTIIAKVGAWADGSSWSSVIERLQPAGYNVTAPQFPEFSLDADLSRLRQVLERQDGPTVVGLVYIAGFGSG